MDCSYVHLDKTSGTKTPCQHPAHGKQKLCVFHSSDARAKAVDFDKALGVLLDQAVASPAPLDLNFKGFIFPKADFRNFVFRDIADFRAAVFAGDVDFRGATFLQQTDFHTAEFRGNAGFFAVIFASNVRFLGVSFRRKAIFNGCKFKSSTAFHGCKFADFASWQGSKFDTPVVFQSNEFLLDADFRQATFFNGVDFSQTLFRRRVDFEGTRFHGEVQFTETHITRGRLNCIAAAGQKDFNGDAVIECSRMDQPMKAYLKEHEVSGNQVWCTELFKTDLEPRSSHLRFTPLPSIPLDKDYESKAQLYQISIA